MKSKRANKFLLSCLILILGLFLAHKPILRGVVSVLMYEDELKKSDAFIVLVGKHERVNEAARLYAQGWAEYMIMTGDSKTEDNVTENMRHNAMHYGIPESQIILEPKAKSTYQHPVYVKPIMKEKGFKSAIVVSSPYHMRRSKMLFDRAFREDDVELIYYPVQKSWFDPENWWIHRRSRKAVFTEYAKFIVNFFGNRFTRFVQKNLLGTV